MYNITELQQLSLEDKIEKTKQIIIEFANLNDNNIATSFSGGKDSTVLLSLVRSVFPNTPAIFFNTTNENNKVLKFTKTVDNVKTVLPKHSFNWTLKYEGYPLVGKEFAESYSRLFDITHIHQDKMIKTAFSYHIIKTKNGAKIKIPHKWLWLYDELMIKKLLSIVDTELFNDWFSYDIEGAKREFDKLRTLYYDVSLKDRELLGLKSNDRIKLTNRCCNVLKKYPASHYQKETNNGLFVGTMAADSELRRKSLLQSGVINTTKNQCYPLAFWTEEDIWTYINKYNIPISAAYETEQRTGCEMCGFGLVFDKDRIERAKSRTPKRVNAYLKVKNIHSDVTFGKALECITEYLNKKEK